MPDTEAALVSVERSDGEAIPVGVAVILLSHPPVNALSSAVARQLSAAVDAVGSNDSIRAVVIYGGEKVFAAGADVREFEHADQATLMRQGLLLERAVAAVAALAKPVVAAVTGYALGGGCELAMAADFRVSADTARWGQPEILLGLIPGAGGTQRLPRLVGVSKAKDLVFSGRYVDGNEARELGLVDVVTTTSEVLDTALELAARYAAGPATALAAAKAAIDGGLDTSLESGLLLERTLFAALFGTADKVTGVTTFLREGAGKAVFATPSSDGS